MNTQCTKCGTNLALPWTFCPHCGLAVVHNPPAASAPGSHQKSSVPGAFAGLLCGVLFAPALIIFGTLLCLTGLGAILGIPVIILGILAPLAGPMFGISEHKTKCPCCGTGIITVEDGQLHYCPSCNREFALDDHGLAKAS